MNEAPTEGLRLLKRHRVRLRRDYRRIQGRGRKIRQGVLLCIFLPGVGPDTRVGITVSRKVGNAVYRNRVKRWLREAIRHERGGLDGVWDVVFIAYPQAARSSASGVRDDVRSVFSRIPVEGRRSRGGRGRR
jgi:ribonuclease P protein component